MCLKTIAALAVALTSSTAFSTSASAAPYILTYNGLTNGTGTPFSAILNLELASSGAIATFISGTRNGIAITGLSDYAAADNRLSFSDPYVSFGGLSYVLTGGTLYNFYYDSTGTSLLPAGAAGYGEVNSITNPTGSGFGSRVTFASVNGVPITPSVPEPASWAMMIVGAGLVGGAMRRRGKVNTSVRFA